MRYTLPILAVVIAFIFVSCNRDKNNGQLTKNDNNANTEITAAGQNATGYEIKDKAVVGSFKYKTLHDVLFNIRVYDELKNPLTEAVIRATTAYDDLTTAVTVENGMARFKIVVTDAVERVSLVVEHHGCVTKTVDIDRIHGVSVVNRTIFLDLNPEKALKSDRDRDGVRDEADEFPDDPSLIGTAHGEYTVAFEDSYPKKGDGDFNDFVVWLGIIEYIDPDNRVRRIRVTSRALAAGSGHTNQFWIRVLGREFRLIADTKKDLGGSWNDREGEAYKEGQEHILDIPLEKPVARDVIEPIPYDPYILCGGDRIRQAHLPYIKTKFAGNSVEGDNVPRAILLPREWVWPYESTRIEAAYPEFESWYASKGASHKEWYLHPAVDRIYRVAGPTMMAAYLLKASWNINTGIILGILGVMIITVTGMNFLRRRHASEHAVSQESVHN
jgi:hypothetical protein